MPRRFGLPVLFAFLWLGGCSDDLLDQVCEPGSVRCTGENDAAEVCKLDGTGYQPGACAVGQRCVTSKVDPNAGVCRDIICAPGERVCGTDNVFVYVCDETGTDVFACTSCAAPPQNGVCIDGRCVSLCEATQKSNIGCEYFAVDLDNAFVPCQRDSAGNIYFCDAQGSQFAVVVSNPDPGTSALVSVTIGEVESTGTGNNECDPDPQPDENQVAAAVVPPKGIKIIELPRRDVNGTVKAQLAYRITTNVPITAYQFNPLQNEDVFSNDASVLLPTNAAGDAHYVMSREQSFDTLLGFITVVGIQDDPTTVSIQTTAKTLAGPGFDSVDPGSTIEVVLEKYEVFNLESDEIGSDFTGSLVLSDRPVIVFGGSEASNAPNTSRCNLQTNLCEFDNATSCECTHAEGPACNPHDKCRNFITCCADHLEQQMYPINAWGSAYVAVRSYPRGNELDVWRFLAAYDNTVLTFTPASVTPSPPPVLNAGEWYEFESGEDFVVEASEPILMGQFLAAQFAPVPEFQPGDADIGDPAFMLGVPIRQWRTTYVFLAPNKYALDYVSIAADKNTTVLLDAMDINEIPAVLTADIQGTDWRAYRVPISDGFHNLSCPETCGVIVHGYDNFVSYGYPGGLNLEE